MHFPYTRLLGFYKLDAIHDYLDIHDYSILKSKHGSLAFVPRHVSFRFVGLLGNFYVRFCFTEFWILSSAKEGTYGWLSTNYLLNGPNVNLENQVGSLDWGGGSAEITFATNVKSTDEVKLFNRSINVFTRSDECYGQHQALIRYYTLLIKDKFMSDRYKIRLNLSFHFK